MSEYNGWTNYETWLVNLWITNDSAEYEYWLDAARTEREQWLGDRPIAVCAARLADAFENNATDALGESGPLRDLLFAALDAVNWHEIARHIMEDAKENAA